ncbi:MAG: Hsp20/alpha crystallin family protein [Anaerovoracaceae bacterium]
MFDLVPFRRNRNRFLDSYFDNFEKNFFSGFDWPAEMTDIAQFRTDILDKGDKYELRADLPGFSKEEIKIDLEGNNLSIYAEHKEEKEEKKENYLRRERRYGSFARSFDVTGIDTGNIDATYKDGVLILELPKASKDEEGKKQIAIK